MSSWQLYIVKCRDGSLYTGITTNLEKRLRRHNEGRASKYTRFKKPVTLIYKECCKNESLARKREIDVKKLSHKNKLELIKKELYCPSKAPNGRFLGTNLLRKFGDVV